MQSEDLLRHIDEKLSTWKKIRNLSELLEAKRSIEKHNLTLQIIHTYWVIMKSYLTLEKYLRKSVEFKYELFWHVFCMIRLSSKNKTSHKVTYFKRKFKVGLSLYINCSVLTDD